MLRKVVMLSIYRRRYNKLFKYVTTAKSAVSTGRQKAPPFNRALDSIMIKKLTVIVGFLIVALISLMNFVNVVSSSVPFEKDSWLAGDLVLKYRMARYLEKEKSLNNFPVEKLVDLLGKPDSSSEDYMFYQVDEPYGYKDGFTVLLKDGKVESTYTHD